MEDNHFDAELDEIIHAAMELTDTPAPELNLKLKHTLYQQEAVMQRQANTRSLSLWYLPMMLNLAGCTMLALAALLVIPSIYLSYFAVGICCYIGLAGVLLTVVGVKRTNLKEEIAIRIEKRGALT